MIKKQTAKWTCADGKKLRLCDMADSHLLNATKFVRRHAELMMNLDHAHFLSLPEPSADHAMDAYESALEQIQNETPEDFLPEIYDKMLLEIKRRKLKIEIN